MMLILFLIALQLIVSESLNVTNILTRKWTNQDGSVMDLHAWRQKEDTSEFSLGGLYTTGVGSAKGVYPLFGIGISKNNVIVFGWQVVWENSMTSWSAYMNAKDLAFSAQWLLTQIGPFEWNSTNIGEDQFVPM